MIASIEPHKLSPATGNSLYLDYVSDRDAAAEFYTHPPNAFAQGLVERKGRTYPRMPLANRLAEYNERIGAHACALAHAEALSQPNTWCVITGQQAGFLGGPVYTAYKIMTTIRLAEHLAALYGTRVVPVFWLASEDHDFYEINHAYLVKPDGEIGRVRFRWREKGRPIVDLPVTGDVKQAYDAYWDRTVPSAYTEWVRKTFSYRAGEGYGEWQARVWSSLFSPRGLVLVEPHIVRPVVPEFFCFALENVQGIQRRLGAVAQRLTAAGYAPALTSELAGTLYTFDAAGSRVRVTDPEMHIAAAASHPERYSTDAALRPLLADAALPIVASVLGPGETAYQAMLKPLYELFEIPQPLLYPRQTYTVVAEREADRLAAYQTHPRAVLTGQLDADAVLRNLVPGQERELYDSARRGIADALAPLRSYVGSIYPGLKRTWEQTVYYATQRLDKLEQRGIEARARQLGFSKGELRRLKNALLPRGRLQERILPLPHFLNRHGPTFVDKMLGTGELGDFSHHVVLVEEGDA
jgi:bacillithiol biosynthesis cysteine-adding enzyme BshC